MPRDSVKSVILASLERSSVPRSPAAGTRAREIIQPTNGNMVEARLK